MQDQKRTKRPENVRLYMNDQIPDVENAPAMAKMGRYTEVGE